VNGVPSCSSTELLTNITRREWNFTGIWVSDCGAIDDILQRHRYTKTGVETVKASLEAGVDLNCGTFFDEYLGEALSSGAVSAATVRASLQRIYTLRMQ
jgi:beta-D-xylosidase 4